MQTAKEAFLSDRTDIALGLARPVIFRSWEDARSSGIDPCFERAPSVLTRDQLEHLLTTRMLGRISSQVLGQYADLVATTGHVIVLADDLGRILYSVGDAPLRGKLDRVNFCPGGVWTVEEVGPNGIGTVLELGSAELVLGHEHFCAGWSPWVCYGAPVHHPETGRILGVVDITGPAETARLETMGLTISIASAVEQQLTLEVYRRHLKLRDEARGLERRYRDESMLVISQQGALVDANTKAVDVLGLSSSWNQHRPLAETMPGLWDRVREHVQVGEAALVDIALESAATSGGPTEVRVRVEPLFEGRDVIGAALMCQPRRAVPTPARDVDVATAADVNTAAVKHAFTDILGQSPALAQAIQQARVAATRARDDAVLIEGETGTGKELFAQAIHRASPRRGEPFIAINCGALPHDLAEAELFGYAPGAFTGARRDGLAGCFEQAAGGTVFLDEVDSLPQDLQVKFLRVVEQGEVTRLGEHRPRPVQMRILAASGQPLEPLVQARVFRADLFHRLNVIGVRLPPLRERTGDVAFLCRHFIAEAAQRYGFPAPTLESFALRALEGYPWPGNVRELMNLCRRLVLNLEADCIRIDDLPDEVLRTLNRSDAQHPHGYPGGGFVGAPQVEAAPLKDVTDQLIEEAISRHGGNVQAAARELGISRATIYRRRKTNLS